MSNMELFYRPHIGVLLLDMVTIENSSLGSLPLASLQAAIDKEMNITAADPVKANVGRPIYYLLSFIVWKIA